MSLHEKRTQEPAAEPADESLDDEREPASRRRLAAVLSLVVATLVWTAAASRFLLTGQVKVALVAVGLVCAVLPLVFRVGETPAAPRENDRAVDEQE